MNNINNQINRMKAMMTYGLKTESENKSFNSLEYHKIGPDGKLYGIIREGNKYYIKVGQNSKDLIKENFDYIGGFTNRKNYEYNSYANALKQFELKMISLKEASNNKIVIESWNPDKKEMLAIEATEKMRKEIERQRQIMNNATTINEKKNYSVQLTNEDTCDKVDKECLNTQKNNIKTDNDKTGDQLGNGGDPFTEKSCNKDIEKNNIKKTVCEDEDLTHEDDFDTDNENNDEFSEDSDLIPQDDFESDEDELESDENELESDEDELESDENELESDEDEFESDEQSIEDRLTKIEQMLSDLSEKLDTKEFEDDSLYDSEDDDFDSEDDDFDSEDDDFDSEDDDFDSEDDDFDSEDDDFDSEDDDFDSEDDDFGHDNYEVYESKSYRRLMENKLNDFGKHPGYRKEVINVKTKGNKKNHGYYGDKRINNEVFGKEVGDSQPFEYDSEKIDNAIAESIKKLKKKI